VEAVKNANLALRFVLELSALAALCYWGAKAGATLRYRIALAVALPLAAATLWGLFVAPNAALYAGPTIRWMVEMLVFTAATAGLLLTGHRTLGALLLVAYVVNWTLMAVWGQGA
jgi:hypothetical protein